ncbi:MAG: hypothetical protein LBD93_02155 [Treponema sp.]|jgi:predicted DNA-binding helix-hairpin-helix protein|nr:hypothetical protein [Treponema sp.]
MFMDVEEKLSILAGAAQYDASCVSGGSGPPQASSHGKTGSRAFGVRNPSGLYKSWTGDGRCISLLKVLYSTAKQLRTEAGYGGYMHLKIIPRVGDALLRVPGIGATAGRRIIAARRSRSLSFDSLRSLGVLLKRARYFITLAEVFLERPDDPNRLRSLLSDPDDRGLQLPLFDF